MLSKNYVLLALTSSALLAQPFSWAGPKQSRFDLNAYLKAFQENPEAVMNALPPRSQSSKKPILSKEFMESDEYYQMRDDLRAKLCHGCMPGRAPIGANDRPENLVDNKNPTYSLAEMESSELQSASLQESPWSDSYWPIYKGGLGHRYGDRNFPGSIDWKDNQDYIIENTVEKILNAPTSTSLDSLSPSEKYDVLVGDKNMSLTKVMWANGKEYYDHYKKVETWMGYCHGWAPAAYMMARPKNLITVIAADGHTKLKFYPSDIKGLGTLLWASAETPTKFMGGRCNDKSPAKDSIGRIKSQDCFDNNPAAWHVAVVNQLGVSKRSFVIDATFDYEVWNQPVFSYKYTYFNPKTNKAVKTLEQAKVAVEDFTNDKFKAYRSKDAKYIVGISMDLTYVSETEPSFRKTDNPSYDDLSTVHYVYDIELNDKGLARGGEWYSNGHPDFVWTPVKGAQAESYGDSILTSEWDPASKKPLPKDWQSAALQASSYGQPLAHVVNALDIYSQISSQTRLRTR